MGKQVILEKVINEREIKIKGKDFLLMPNEFKYIKCVIYRDLRE